MGAFTPKTIIEYDDTFSVTTQYTDDGLTTVSIFGEYGIHGRGHARLSAGDKYDPEIGKVLAYSRALRRYEQRMEKFVIKNLVESA